ncbi:MAG: photosystem II cytochrome c-550 [Cyanobacteria bacterium P01_D01_bin.1]
MLYIFKNVLNKVLVVYILLVTLMLTFSMMNSAIAGKISPTNRTILLDASGETTMLTTQKLMQGQRKFNESCAQCHIDGGSKTNPDVDLGQLSLANATPARNHVEGIVDYLHDPTSYDGLQSLSEFHPSMQRADLFPRMRGLSEDDLSAIAGYILAEPQIIGEQWAGGKPKR